MLYCAYLLRVKKRSDEGVTWRYKHATLFRVERPLKRRELRLNDCSAQMKF